MAIRGSGDGNGIGSIIRKSGPGGVTKGTSVEPKNITVSLLYLGKSGHRDRGPYHGWH